MDKVKTHTILKPEDCGCDGLGYCNICDGGLWYCVVCYAGEIELEQYTCEEYQRRGVKA